MYELYPSIVVAYSVVDSEYNRDRPTDIKLASSHATKLEGVIATDICDSVNCEPSVVGEVVSHERTNKPRVLQQRIGCLACTSDCAQMIQTPIAFGEKVAKALYEIISTESTLT